ncbi:clathrin light chain [Schizosaccharomyces cryophilus OY26]|uniref:Clathrin light chain n=1 Tax=Schizosaccharomyces cryophilus (strain OY26 / ATCC MYA-4695 / CBS 11777 / NBRC 106824 / NRRL Y48691) TaxID=653667 RepID=S9VZ71_SCHCR|nr:clathrin light chain [Schizosaccharomyces cryophilus OY26]EPY52918.1 clathrin light chain [Schizosaccharomyces cryophilus OY26]
MSQFPALEDFDVGLGSAPEGKSEQTDFLEREKLALGEDANQFETLEDKDALLGFENDPEAEKNNFEKNFPPIDTEMQTSGTFSAPKTPYMAQAEVHPPEHESEDSEPIHKWKEENERRIREKDEASRRLYESNVEKARKAIDDFYENYNDKKDKIVAKSREEQKNLLEKNEAASSGTTSWQRILKLVDLSDKAEASGRSTQRFHELLTSLAKDESAPGAGGNALSA